MKFKALVFAGLALMGAAAQAATLGNTLNANYRMVSGDNLLTKNGYYSLAMQSDGNLVIYNISNGGSKPMWSTGAAGPYSYVAMQNDGNLALYHSNNTWSWTSKTGGRPVDSRFRLVLQETGELDIYDPSNTIIWYANRPSTGGPTAGLCSATQTTYSSWPIYTYVGSLPACGTVQARCLAEAQYWAQAQNAKVGSCPAG
jgi:hypothetical protein